MAERAEFSAGQESVTLYEITEAVTDPEYSGRGLYRLVSGALSQHVRKNARQELSLGAADLAGIYGESNLSSPGVIYAARGNGRVVAADYPPESVSDKYGILEQNFKVNDGQDTRPYNDFALTWVPIDDERP